MNKKFVFLVMIIALFCITGCQSNKKGTEAEAPAIHPIDTEIPLNHRSSLKEKGQDPVSKPAEADLKEGQVKSRLTGQWIEEEISNQRPYAVMFNNIKVASPQCGTSQAAILYEALTEGGITRMMGIFETITGDRIGSVRSARHYFVSIADEYDAIYVHYGQTKYALNKIKELGVDNLSGLEAVGSTIFYRDHTIKAPHNAFASADGIYKGRKQKNYRSELKLDEKAEHFQFYNQDTQLEEGISAQKVTLKFSGYTSPYFVYQEDDKKYYRYQFGTEHIDKNTGKQLSFKNLIVQYVKEWTLDNKGYQSMDIENSEGTGYYITNGKAVPITWKKKEVSGEMAYYDTEGKLLSINPGNTYIGLFPDKNTKDVVFSDNK